jgi:hypothetical protein
MAIGGAGAEGRRKEEEEEEEELCGRKGAIGGRICKELADPWPRSSSSTEDEEEEEEGMCMCACSMHACYARVW